MLDKHYVLYDDIIRVPLVVRYPGNLPHTSSEFVYNCLDVPASLPSWLGIELPVEPHGHILPLISSGESGKQHITCSSNGQQFGLYTARSIRTQRWKYVWNLTDIDELYDLWRDPGEKINLIAELEGSELLADLRHDLWIDLVAFQDPFTKSSWLKHQLLDGKIIPPGKAR